MPEEYNSLHPTEHLVRTYADPAGNQVELTVLYWAPRQTHPGPSAVQPRQHNTYYCMRGAGWERDILFDDVATVEWLADAQLYTGGFKKPGRRRLVLFWNNNEEEYPRLFSPKDLRKRLAILVRSWTDIPAAVIPRSYGVKIEIDIENEPAEAKNIALGFARNIAGLLPAFGIGRTPDKQDTDMNSGTTPSLKIEYKPAKLAAAATGH